MGRLFVYGAAVTSVVLLSLIYVVLAAGSGSGITDASPHPSAGVLGTIQINAFDLGFEPATVDVAEPGTYT